MLRSLIANPPRCGSLHEETPIFTGNRVDHPTMSGSLALVDDPLLLHDVQFHDHSRAIANPHRRVETGKKELPDDGEAWSP